MLKQHYLALGVSLACCLPAGAQAGSDIDTLRAEIRQMRQQYEDRLAELESRLRQRESQAAPVPDRPPTPAQGKGGLEASLILQGSYTHRKNLADRHLPGFMPAGHEHGGGNGFNLDHTELVLSANIDPLWRGHANFGLADGEVEVEEAWFQSLGLGHGLSLKGGRFYSGLGYLNERHPHAWDFSGAPLMYQALFGERFNNDGLQLKWLAPMDTFLEFGLEAGRGGNFPGASGSGNGVGAWSAFFHVGDDLNASHSWRAGLAYLRARPKGREGDVEDLNDVEMETLFNGRSRAWVADFVWKWAPEGNPRVNNFAFQAEYFRRTEGGNMTCEDNTAASGACIAGLNDSDAYRSKQSGWYAQGVYQFMPRWRVGARWERLDTGDMSFGVLPLQTVDYRPNKWSLMTDWSPSEFSRLRLQYGRDRSMQGITDHQWTLQYIMSLGAHGAHKF